MKLSTHNVSKGTINKLIPGAVNSEVIIQLPGGAEIVSAFTKESVKNLGLKEGKQAYVVIKSTCDISRLKVSIS